MKKLFLIIFLVFYPLASFAVSSDCSKQGVRECVSTKGCFLECVSKDPKKCGSYKCREAENKCESEFAQLELTPEACHAISGCVYEKPFCFCPGPMECYCGGGAPASCRIN